VKLRKYLLSLKGKRTLILITHRPSLLDIADRHFMVKDNQVKEIKWK